MTPGGPPPWVMREPSREPAKPAAPGPARVPLRPFSDADIVRYFGDPTPYINDDGSVSRAWEMEHMSYAVLPAPLPLTGSSTLVVRKLRVHRRAVAQFEDFFAALFNEPEVWKTIGDCAGAYNWRPQRRSKALSRHAWGVAVDLDVGDNPFGDATPNVHPRTIALAEEFGFAWGGFFAAPRTDGMHYEAADPFRLTG